MPKKLNKAGQSQEYVPAGNGDASGEYADDGGSNRYFASFKRPDEDIVKVEPKQEEPKKELGVKVEKEGDKPADTKKIKPAYEGKGKQLLNDELSKRLGKSTNKKAILDAVSDADDELSGVVADLYANNEDIKIKVGKNINSKCRTEYSFWDGKKTQTVEIGQGVLDASADNYSKGGVFFHESGHALDNTLDVGKQWSNHYVSKATGKSLGDQIREEMKAAFDSPKKINGLKEEIYKEKENYKKQLFTDEEDAEYENLSNQYVEIQKKLREVPEIIALQKKWKDLDEEVSNISWSYWSANGEEKNKIYENLMSKKEELRNAYQYLENYRNDYIAKTYPDLEQINNRKKELNDKKYQAARKAESMIQVKYGDLSDMMEASVGVSLTGMGHGNSYWYKSGMRGQEAFAEIMSAKATNPESLSVMKKYCPKSLEIFDEIIGEIRGNKDNG